MILKIKMDDGKGFVISPDFDEGCFKMEGGSIIYSDASIVLCELIGKQSLTETELSEKERNMRESIKEQYERVPKNTIAIIDISDHYEFKDVTLEEFCKSYTRLIWKKSMTCRYDFGVNESANAYIIARATRFHSTEMEALKLHPAAFPTGKTHTKLIAHLQESLK